MRKKYAKYEQIFSEIFEKFTFWAKSALMKDIVLETLWVVLYIMKISEQNLAPKLKLVENWKGFNLSLKKINDFNTKVDIRLILIYEKVSEN